MNRHSLDCSATKSSFSGYLDGAISGRDMASVAAHLERCTECRREFEQWRALQQVLGTAGRVRVPADLGVKLRVAISRENSRRQSRWFDTLGVRWDNLLRPALLQAAAGLASALVLVGGIAMLLGAVAAPEAVLANDEPLGAMTTPHLRYEAAPLPPVATPTDTTLVVQAQIDAQGRVYDFSVLSGPRDPAVLTQVRNHLLVQVYEPARVFGDAIPGRVLITFAGLSVRG